MFFNKTSKIHAITEGVLIDLSHVSDPVFAQKLVGDGYAIEPTSHCIHAPCDGVITVVFPTKHAYGLKTTQGVEILIHLGIDTVELKGNGFVSHVLVGERVKKGQLIAEMDLDVIHKSKKQTTSMVIVTSGEAITHCIRNQNVTLSDVIITL